MSFASFLAERGLIVDHVIPDGRVHRTTTDDHLRKRNGAYLFDGVSGWAQNWAIDIKAIRYRSDAEPDPLARAEMELIARTRREETERMRKRAASKARKLISEAKIDAHPYLAAKGFPAQAGLVWGSTLLVPMWDFRNYGKELFSVQSIAADGSKKFLPGGRAKGAVHMIGSHAEYWHCEGYATALSVVEGLRRLCRKATAVVSFSAGNLTHVASQMGGIVVADNDASGAGEAAALATGLAWVMPPDVGTDANDLHQARGIEALADLMRIAL